MKHRKHTTFRPPPPPSVAGISTGPRLRCATLHRVSKLDRQDPSLARDALRAHAAAIGDLVLEVEERGSGSKRDREGLNTVMEAARRRQFDVLVCWKLDRVSRSLAHLYGIATTLDAYGVALSCVTQPGIDTRTPTGKLLFAILGALSELERDQIRERVMLGLDRARKRGKRLGRPKKLHPTVEQVVALKAANKSWRQIAGELGANVNVCRLRWAEHAAGKAGQR